MTSFDLHVFRIRNAETFWYIATSREDALEQFRTDPQWEHEDDDDVKHADVGQLGERDQLTIENAATDGSKLTRSAREWCALEGRGYIGSTCY